MLIPQGMAYAMLAGLPPVYGLYAAIAPQIVYAIFGTSRQLSVGPVAMDSLVVAASLTVIAQVDSSMYIPLALFLAFTLGLIQLGMGVLRLGFLVNFLSKPVISGFTTGAAIITGIYQLKYLFGLELASSDSITWILHEISERVNEWSFATIGIGVIGIVLIVLLKKIHRMIPGALVVVILSIIISYIFKLHESGVAVVGFIPEGLPKFGVPSASVQQFKELLPTALSLAVIAFMEAVSVAKALQAKHKEEYQIDPNQELIALGLSNVIGSMFGSYPTTGGFSRSAVSDDAGAKTNMAAIFSAVLVILTLLFMTPLFFHLPKAILSSIILVAIIGLVDVKYPMRLWKTKRSDFLMLLVTAFVTIFVGIKEGIGAGVLLSILMLVYRSTRPHAAVLVKLKGGNGYRNVERFDSVKVRDDVIAIRYDAELYFANCTHFYDFVIDEVERRDNPKLVVLNFESVSAVDATALQKLQELVAELQNREIVTYFSCVIGPVRDYFKKSGFIDRLGEEAFFLHIQQAIDYYDEKPKTLKKIRFDLATQSNSFNERLI